MAFGRSTERIMRLSVELATIIHARRNVDAAFESYEPGEILPPLYRDFVKHHDELLKSKAIELAVNLRIFLDVDEVNQWFLDKDAQLGEFLKPKKAPMTLRDCANKLIHTTGYFADAEMSIAYKGGLGLRINPPKRRALSEVVNMYGVDGRKKWECRVDLLRFAQASHALTFRWDPES